jgi:oxygen-dependent protoporphyrinogen oxidase
VLRARGFDVRVLEASERAGGMIRSERIEGQLVEHGPASVRGASADAWAMLGLLGLQEQLLPADGSQSLRFLLKDGALVALPSGPGGILTTPLLSPRGRLRVLAEPLVPANPREGETVFDLLSRRGGAEAADVLGTPFVGGIFGGDPRDVEARAALPRLAEWELSGSLLRGSMAAPRAPAGAPKGSATFAEGLETLPRALAAGLGDSLRLRRRVTKVERRGSGWRVSAEGGGGYDADEVVVAVPPIPASQIVAGQSALAEIPHAPIAAVHLGWEEGAVQAPRGFGWLAHPRQTTDALGAIYVSSIFPSHAPGKVLVRLMIGGTRAPGLVAGSDDALVQHAKNVLAMVNNLRAEPTFSHVARALPGIPQYLPGHTARLAALRETGLRWLGWGWTGLGVPDQLAAARALADAITGSRFSELGVGGPGRVPPPFTGSAGA